MLLKYQFVYVIISFILFSCGENTGADKTNKAASEIAAANGIDNFSKLASIEFTFNVEKDSNHLERHWKWQTRDNMITYYGKEDSTVFKRMDTTTAELKKLNAQFTNDEYWLIFPYHLQWDKGYTFTANEKAAGPVTDQQYLKYTIQYNAKDGFTPGDMYEVYTDDKHIIREWAFHKSGSAAPSLMTTWEGYQNFEGLNIAKEHFSKDKKFHLYFTNIKVSK